MSDPKVVDLDQVTVADLEKIRNRNVQKLQALGQQGAGVDTTSVMARRLDVFLELFLSEEQRVQFEYAFEVRMSESLDKGLAEVRAAKLTQGVGQAVAQNPKLIVPGR